MNSSAGEARAAKLLSNVMDARRRLEEDAEVVGAVTAASGAHGVHAGTGAAAAAAAAGVDDAAGAGLRGRLEQAMAVAEVRGLFLEREGGGGGVALFFFFGFRVGGALGGWGLGVGTLPAWPSAAPGGGKRPGVAGAVVEATWGGGGAIFLVVCFVVVGTLSRLPVGYRPGGGKRPGVAGAVVEATLSGGSACGTLWHPVRKPPSLLLASTTREVHSVASGNAHSGGTHCSDLSLRCLVVSPRPVSTPPLLSPRSIARCGIRNRRSSSSA